MSKALLDEEHQIEVELEEVNYVGESRRMTQRANWEFDASEEWVT